MFFYMGHLKSPYLWPKQYPAPYCTALGTILGDLYIVRKLLTASIRSHHPICQIVPATQQIRFAFSAFLAPIPPTTIISSILLRFWHYLGGIYIPLERYTLYLSIHVV